MVVRNEAGRYLKACLDHLSRYVDEMVILDDASTDATYEICAGYAKVKVLERNEHPLFWENEFALRQKLWEMTKATRPEWVLAIDADEIFEDRIIYERHQLLTGKHYWVAFRLFEFWGSLTYYRVDKMWNPYNRFGIYIFRYIPGFRYRWHPQPLHCGRVPCNLLHFDGLYSDIRLRHYGWANPCEHRSKYRLYTERDPQGKYSPLSHYQSILDPDPVLERWEEWPLTYVMS